MKLKVLLGGFAAALLATSALAAGYFTNGLTSYPAASLVGTETIPADTNLAAGLAPQSVGITTAAVKTYANGGAAVSGTSSAGAVTANGERVNITTESLSTAAAAIFTETLTNSSIAATSIVTCSVGQGTNTTDGPTIMTITPASGSAVIKVKNTHASVALNGTLTLACRVQ